MRYRAEVMQRLSEYALIKEAKNLHECAYGTRMDSPVFEYAQWMRPLAQLWYKNWFVQDSNIHIGMIEAYKLGYAGDLAAVEAYLGLTELAEESDAI